MFEPQIEDWALREMEEQGLDIDEYCNTNCYNIADILTEPDDDEVQ